MKTCILCRIEKHEIEFGTRNANKDKLESKCKVCVCKNKREYRNKNKEHDKIVRANYCKKNKNKKCNKANKIVQRAYYLKNKDKILKKHKEYNDKNKKSISIRQNNKIKARRKFDALYKLKRNIRSLVYASIINGGYSKESNTYKLLGCKFEDFFRYLGPQPSPNHQMDHICPCAQAKTEEELIKLQYYTNFQWLHKDDNLAKLHHITPEGEKMCRILLGREWI